VEDPLLAIHGAQVRQTGLIRTASHPGSKGNPAGSSNAKSPLRLPEIRPVPALGVDWNRQCAAVIPACNEAATIRGLVHAVCTHVPTVFVVNDGSRDDTARWATEAGARVLSHPRTRGKGAALRTGLTAACAAGMAWAVTLDADGQHAAEDIPLLFQAAEREHAALIIGNRMQNLAGMSITRRLVNRWMSRRLSRRVGFDCPDSQCGFRLLQLEVWAGLATETDHFEVESELLVQFARAGRRVVFVPVQCLAARRPSHVRPVTDTLRWFRWWWGAGGDAGKRR
jgi:glycosyltransferase involved in cell wall biosynthesis